jgi:hypothetical protein
MTSNAKAAGRFGKQDFIYKAADDIYRCPAGERLAYRYTSEEERQDAAPILDNRVPSLLDEGQMYDRSRAPDLAVGARSCS